MASDDELTLYHGTTEESAAVLMIHGWTPGSGSSGANQGQTRLLYLTTEPENALWFADQRGGGVVLEVVVPLSSLVVDPEDGIGDTVEEELEIARRHGLPANLASKAEIEARRFSLMPPTAAPRV